jgi:cation transport regulator ChaC
MKLSKARKKIITYLKTKQWVKEERDKLEKEKIIANEVFNQKQKDIDYFLESNIQKLIKGTINKADIQTFEESIQAFKKSEKKK